MAIKGLLLLNREYGPRGPVKLLIPFGREELRPREASYDTMNQPIVEHGQRQSKTFVEGPLWRETTYKNTLQITNFHLEESCQ